MQMTNNNIIMLSTEMCTYCVYTTITAFTSIVHSICRHYKLECSVLCTYLHLLQRKTKSLRYTKDTFTTSRNQAFNVLDNLDDFGSYACILY